MRRFAVIALFFCALLSCKEEAVTPTALPLASVSVENVFGIDMPIQLILPGTTSSVQDVEVEARVQGWLTQRHFQQGQEVVKGDLLYEIDATSFDLQRMQSISVMESAAAQLDYAQKEYDRNEPLVKTGAVSMQTFDQLQSQLEEALAQLTQAEAGVALAELNVSYCSIHAPISGIIGKT
ncbi:MAG: efflux RND transporter periplasmic adaptor subunit, partial [Phycisphaerae bacterium]|nr:efflux RND transporter periplasmic adaptor subunit [Phycisphaerae bacterium]